MRDRREREREIDAHEDDLDLCLALLPALVEEAAQDKEEQVGVDIALVHLVDAHVRHAIEERLALGLLAATASGTTRPRRRSVGARARPTRRAVQVGLHATEKEARRAEQDAAVPPRRLGLEADLVPDRVSNLLAALLGDALGDRDGRDAARLGADNVAPGALARHDGVVEDELRQLGRLARAGGGEDDDDARGGDLCEDARRVARHGEARALLAQLGDGGRRVGLVRLEARREHLGLLLEVRRAELGAPLRERRVDTTAAAGPTRGPAGLPRARRARRVVEEPTRGHDGALLGPDGLVVFALDHVARAAVQLALAALPHGLAQLVLDVRRHLKDDVRGLSRLFHLAHLLAGGPVGPEGRVALLEVRRRVEVGAVLRVLLGPRLADADLGAADAQRDAPRLGAAVAPEAGDRRRLQVRPPKVVARAWSSGERGGGVNQHGMDEARERGRERGDPQ